MSARAGLNLDPSNPINFFTNLASRLLQSQLDLSLNQIQVWPTNQYTPAVHRLLQVSANIYDACTNDPLPSVFRPVFRKEGANVFIAGYAEAATDVAARSRRPLDLNKSDDRAALQPDDNVWGVPWVIGAKKGVPNFNEFALESVFGIARKLELTRLNVNSLPNRTNMMYVVNVSNVLCGVELWNSYRSNYNRAVKIYVTNEMSLTMVVTNEIGAPVLWPTNGAYELELGAVLAIAADEWKGRTKNQSPFGSLEKASFRVPLMANVVFLPGSIYRFDPPGFSASLNSPFEVGQGFPQPRFYLAVTNRLRCIIVDQVSGRVIDYVQLGGLNTMRDLSEEIRDENNTLGYQGLWATNRIGLGGIYSPPLGVQNQIYVSLGYYGTGDNLWKNSGIWAGGQNPAQIEAEIDQFRAFMGYSSDVVNTNLVQQAPFSASKRMSQLLTWQANDPLVHYSVPDLQFEESVNGIEQLPVAGSVPLRISSTISNLNIRYLPWGFDPTRDPVAFNPAVKDPLMRSSEDWNFPTNKSPGFSWLGRVHRGTPWQTLYLKSGAATLTMWKNWSGHGEDSVARQTHPTNDWKLAGLLSVLVNTNDVHQLLSVNDASTDAWLSTLGGLLVMTNTTTDSQLALVTTQPTFDTMTMESNSPQAALIADAVSVARAAQSHGYFHELGDILAVPQLSMNSPWLNTSTTLQLRRGLTEEAYEIIPSQLLSRLRPDSVGMPVQEGEIFKIRFTGLDDHPYAVEVSSNLTGWSRAITNYPTNGVFEFTPPPANGCQAEFYRSVLLP